MARIQVKFVHDMSTTDVDQSLEEILTLAEKSLFIKLSVDGEDRIYNRDHIVAVYRKEGESAPTVEAEVAPAKKTKESVMVPHEVEQ